MNVPDGIQSMIRTVVENAYLRSALLPAKKQIVELTADERAGVLEQFEHAISCDVELLRAAFVQYAAVQTAHAVSERLNDVTLKSVVFDTEESERDGDDGRVAKQV